MTSTILGILSEREVNQNIEMMSIDIPPGLLQELKDSGLLHPDRKEGGV